MYYYKKIPGTELTADFYHHLNAHEKEDLAHDIAYFLYELHNSLDTFQCQQLGLHATGWPWDADTLQQERVYLDDLVLIDIFDQFVQQYKQFKESVATTTLIHNDMIVRNIIVDETTKKLSGIIDFTDVALDDPQLDLRLNYTSIPSLSESIAHHYGKLNHKTINLKKIYSYYVATEFSRYEQHKKENKKSLDIIKTRITTTFSLLQQK